MAIGCSKQKGHCQTKCTVESMALKLDIKKENSQVSIKLST